MKFIKKHLFLIIIIVLIVLFILLAFLTKDSTVSKNEEINSWYYDTKEDEYVVTVYAQTSCSHCKNMHPIMDQVHNEYDFNLYWLELDLLEENDVNLIRYTYDLVGFSGTPYTLVTKNGKVITYHSGSMQKDALIEFLSDSGVIE